MNDRRDETLGPVFGRRDPDARGYFGEFGGRFVPETLMAPIEELEAAYFEARRDPEFVGTLTRTAPATTSAGRRRCTRRRRARRRLAVPPVPQARGPRAHRRAQDQQRARPGAARRADGQARIIAETGAGQHGVATATVVRAARPRVRRLHGRGRHGAAGAERLPHAAARRDGRAGRQRHPHAEGRDQRSDARLGRDTPTRRTTCSARCSARIRIR